MKSLPVWRVDISGNGCLSVKSERIINYLINANNDQLKHPVVHIPPSSGVTKNYKGLGDANHGKVCIACCVFPRNICGSM